MKIYNLKNLYYSLVFNIFIIFQGMLLYSFSLTAGDKLFIGNTLQYIYGTLFIFNLLSLSIIYIIFSYKIKKEKLLLIKKSSVSIKMFNYKIIVLSGIFTLPFSSYILKNYNNISNIDIYNASQIIGCIFGSILIILALINIILNLRSLKTKFNFLRKI